MADADAAFDYIGGKLWFRTSLATGGNHDPGPAAAETAFEYGTSDGGGPWAAANVPAAPAGRRELVDTDYRT